MDALAIFSPKNLKPTGLNPAVEITTALPVTVSTMEKTYVGDIQGESLTFFTAAFDHATKVGTYIAMESFQGTVNGRTGTFNFVHSASTTGSERNDEFFCIVAGSGTNELKGISGSGEISIDGEGTHRIRLNYQLA
ncbi:DUF3224 domain-containing protein [Pseudomonas sp. SWRI59]|uniref:DUF3224 domain-containing protein n=1 Tax=Pseudomonas TaxID=286 RepID=UPI0016487577|nr:MULTISPECIES: DUF3224 domain-containing protein [unclassified Pseudomonas]MBC3504863.1 DUF3224 domain-containing protein [Pseudomonas sp. SWRI59]MBC3510095.1 DUF3224 domain-containing protein [Pseudomonas sp. SWRI68]